MSSVSFSTHCSLDVVPGLLSGFVLSRVVRHNLCHNSGRLAPQLKQELKGKCIIISSSPRCLTSDSQSLRVQPALLQTSYNKSQTSLFFPTKKDILQHLYLKENLQQCMFRFQLVVNAVQLSKMFVRKPITTTSTISFPRLQCILLRCFLSP